MNTVRWLQEYSGDLKEYKTLEFANAEAASDYASQLSVLGVPDVEVRYAR